MIEPALLTRLARLLRVEASELRVEPLTGGLSNRGFLLTRGSEQWAVRLPLAFGTDKASNASKTSCAEEAFDDSEASGAGETVRAGEASGTGRASRTGGASDTERPSFADKTSFTSEKLSIESERRVLAVAAEAKLAPEVIACDAETGALVTRYLRGAASLNAERIREFANIDRIAAMLRRLHNLPAPTGLRAFRPTELAQIYVDAAAESNGAPHENVDERHAWSVEFRRLARAYEAAFKPTALCHNDLVAANILDDGRLWLVDFEYAVRADPILDLAGLAGLNGFGPAHRHRLLDAYYGPRRAPISIAQLEQTIRLVRLMAFFWALVHGGGDANDGQASFAAAMAAVLR